MFLSPSDSPIWNHENFILKEKKANVNAPKKKTEKKLGFLSG